VGALTANRKAATVTDPSVTTDLDQAFNVHGDLFAQVSFDAAFILEDALYPKDLVLGKVFDLDALFDLGLLQNLSGSGSPDAVDVRQADLGPLGRR
jgi:hypothetical protein